MLLWKPPNKNPNEGVLEGGKTLENNDVGLNNLVDLV